MLKRILVVILVVVCILGSYSGYKWYYRQQTPQHATEQFAKALTAGPEESYDWLTADLQKDREAYWKKYLADFAGKPGSLSPVGGAALEDRFNTYTDAEKPYRSFYIFDLNGNEYWLTIVVVHKDKGWKVAELFGSYHYK